MEHRFKSITFSKVRVDDRWRIQVSLFGLVIAISNTPIKFQSRRTVNNLDERNQRVKLKLLMERGCRCELCGADLVNKKAEMHHIKPVSFCPELRHEPSNLMILCHDCHNGIHQKANERANMILAEEAI